MKLFGQLTVDEAREFFSDLFELGKPPGATVGDFDLGMPDPMGLCTLGYTERVYSEMMAMGHPGPAVAAMMPRFFIAADFSRVFPDFYTMEHMEQISFNSAQDRIGPGYTPRPGSFLWFDWFAFPAVGQPVRPNLYGGRVPTPVKQAYCGYEQPFKDEQGQISYAFAMEDADGRVVLNTKRTFVFAPKYCAEYAKKRVEKQFTMFTGNPNPGGIDFSPLPNP